jgi:Arc/MetJ family transcription regulator
MRTTIDIPDKDLAELMRHTGAATKREAVLTAIVDFNRRRRLAKLFKRFRTSERFLSPDELHRARSEG